MCSLCQYLTVALVFVRATFLTGLSASSIVPHVSQLAGESNEIYRSRVASYAYAREHPPLQENSSQSQPRATKISECDFPNRIKPSRVDNTCKAVLDDVALRLQRQTDSRLVIVGNAKTSESDKTLAAKRAANAQAYLSGGEAKQAIDTNRIELRTGSRDNALVEFWEVPAGADFPEQGTRLVDIKQLGQHGAVSKHRVPQ